MKFIFCVFFLALEMTHALKLIELAKVGNTRGLEFFIKFQTNNVYYFKNFNSFN